MLLSWKIFFFFFCHRFSNYNRDLECFVLPSPNSVRYWTSLDQFSLVSQRVSPAATINPLSVDLWSSQPDRFSSSCVVYHNTHIRLLHIQLHIRPKCYRHARFQILMKNKSYYIKLETYGREFCERKMNCTIWNAYCTVFF